MAEYIEREAAKKKLIALYKAYDTDGNHERKLALLEIDLALQAIPAADVVPVVRCKDCEYWDATQEAPLSEGCFLCTLEGGYPKGDFYCALGERRMDGDGE